MHYLDDIINQAELKPEALALISDSHSLTYKRLIASTIHLANYLWGLGIGNESIVGVCMNKGPNVVVSMLSIARVNACYFLIDSETISKERASNLEREGVGVVLVENTEIARNFSIEIKVLDISVLSSMSMEGRRNQKLPPITGEGAAYVQETSGTLGTRKKIVIEKNSVNSLVNAMHCENYRLLTGGVRLSYCRISFDVFIEDVLRSLCFGGCLILPPREVSLNMALLLDWIGKYAVEHLEVTPAYARKIMNYCAQKGVKDISLKTLVLGGDVIPEDLLSNLMSFFRGIRLFNSYGTSETTINNAVQEVVGLDTAFKWDSFLKHSIPNVVNYSAQSDERSLHISGECLMRGYLNNVALTDESLLEVDGNKVYATNDRIAVLKNGIDILGRTDQGAKLNGILINYLDIENALKECLGIKSCLVFKNSTYGDSEVVFVLSTDPIVKSFTNTYISESLRNTNVSELASYLVFDYVDGYPLSENGKLIREVVQKVGEAEIRINSSASFSEVDLLNIWRNLFPFKEVNEHDDFFLLGASSIVLIDYLTILEDKFNIVLEVFSLYESGSFVHQFNLIRDAIETQQC